MFRSLLKDRQLDWVMDYKEYVNPTPHNMKDFTKLLFASIKNKEKILIIPDPDPDGVLSAFIIKSFLDLVGYKNYVVFEMNVKHHGLTTEMVDDIISSDFDLIFIVDSSSNDITNINSLLFVGKKVLIVDHHEVTEDLTNYPTENFVLINSKSEEYFVDEKIGWSTISAGFLCYIVVANLIKYITGNELKKKAFLNYMFNCGYITLYTDSCDLSNDFCISIIQRSNEIKDFVPKPILMFMSDYDLLNRGFIEYKLSPRLNACMRLNEFKPINSLFFKFNKDKAVEDLKRIEECYKLSKELVNKLVSSTLVRKYDNFVLTDLDDFIKQNNFSEVDSNALKNFTGLVSNMLMTKYSKIAITIISNNEFEYKGSVRDPYSRKLLNIFKIFIYAGGHMSAFGIKCKKGFFNHVFKQINELINKSKTDKSNAVLELNGDDIYGQEKYNLAVMAEYNEISGNYLPIAYIKLKINHVMKINRYENYCSLTWNDIRIISFKNINVGDIILVKPTKDKNGVKCFVDIVL